MRSVLSRALSVLAACLSVRRSDRLDSFTRVRCKLAVPRRPIDARPEEGLILELRYVESWTRRGGVELELLIEKGKNGGMEGGELATNLAVYSVLCCTTTKCWCSIRREKSSGRDIVP